MQDSLSEQITNCSYSFLNQGLLLSNLYTRIAKPGKNGTLTLRVHPTMIYLLQYFRYHRQGQRCSWMVDASYNGEKPLLCPHSFASVVFNTKRFTIKIRWERRMVSKTFAFHRNRFLGCRNNHVDIVVQHVRRVVVVSVLLKRRS